jgi:hypothetical protein
MFRAAVKEAWYQLSKEEQDALFAKIQDTMKSVGGKSMLVCNSSWNSEQWLFWGVEEFPSLEAVQEYARCLEELNWFRYVDAEILLGSKAEEPEQA